MPVLDELLVRIGMDTSGVEQGTEQVNQELGGLSAPAAAAGLAVGGLFAAGLANAMDASAATSKLQTQLDLTDEEAARAGSIAGDVYSAGFSDSIGGVSEAMSGVIQAMGGMGEVTDKELEDLTKNALMLAQTFEMDVSEAATAAGQLIANDLAGDGQEAFDILTRAAQTLPKSMIADIPATINEYGKHFQRMGLDGQTAFGMMSQYVQAGGRDIDQAADVIHEFARITSEETDRAAEGFKALGLDSKKMLEDIGKGGEPAEAALGKTLAALRGVKDPAKQAALGVQLFGDMAGEGADALWAMDPATAAATSGMDQAAGAAKKATENMEASQSLSSIWRTLATTLGEILAPALKVVADFLAENPGLIKVLIPVLIGLAVAIGIAVIAQWAWNTALWAFPGTWIIAGIIALIAVIILIIVYWDEIAAATGEAWDWITGKLSDAWGWITRKASEFWGWLTSVFSDGWDWLRKNVFNPIGDFFTRILPGWIGDGADWIQDTWNDLVDWFGAIPGRLARLGSGMWQFITNGLKAALNGAIGLVNDGIFFINAHLIGNANRIPGVNIPYIPYVPYLAEGGITTGPTMAMIGEGSEQEAVLPLSKLEALINVPSSMPAPSVDKVQPVQVYVTPRVDGSAFQNAFQYEVRTRAGSSVARYAGEE